MNLLLLLAVAAASGPDFSFMRGEWTSCAPGEQVEEHWLGPSPAGLVGVALTRRGERADFEHMRIAPDSGGWAFIASPQGRTATRFPMVSHSADAVVFENPKHDFPKRISYRRRGDTLLVAATGLDGAGPSWTYRRRSEAGC